MKASCEVSFGSKCPVADDLFNVLYEALSPLVLLEMLHRLSWI